MFGTDDDDHHQDSPCSGLIECCRARLEEEGDPSGDTQKMLEGLIQLELEWKELEFERRIERLAKIEMCDRRLLVKDDRGSQVHRHYVRVDCARFGPWVRRQIGMSDVPVAMQKKQYFKRRSQFKPRYNRSARKACQRQELIEV